MPWWKSLLVMNENKGVFELNMLHWWDTEGNLDRVVEPLMADLAAGRLQPVVAEAFLRPRRDAHDHRRMRSRKVRLFLHRRSDPIGGGDDSR